MINSLHERQFYPTRLSDTYSDFWLLTRRCVSKGRCSERQHYHVCWIDHAESTCLSHFSLQNPVHSCSYDGLWSKCSAAQNMWWYREPYKLLEFGDQYMMSMMMTSFLIYHIAPHCCHSLVISAGLGSIPRFELIQLAFIMREMWPTCQYSLPYQAALTFYCYYRYSSGCAALRWCFWSVERQDDQWDTSYFEQCRLREIEEQVKHCRDHRSSV